MRSVWVFASSRQATGEIANGLAELGLAAHHFAAGDPAGAAANGAPRGRPTLAVVVAGPDEELRTELVEHLMATEELEGVGVLLVVEHAHLRSHPPLDPSYELLVRPFTAAELKARVARASRTVASDPSTVVRAGSLELNLATYQARIGDRPIGFTYMEYRLLEFLLTHPNRVFSREALLRRVWNYEYYGGARTIDVHVRRLRAKLGQEHAWRVKTVRSVGYLFELPEGTRASA